MLSQEQRTEELYETYRDSMDEAERGLYATIKGGLDEHDYYALGRMHENVDSMHNFLYDVNEASPNDLHVKPTLQHAVVDLSFNTGIMNLIASNQPIESRRGLVHYMRTVAADAAGNLAAGEVIADPRQNLKTPQGYASAKEEEFLLGTGDGTETTFTATLPHKVQSQTLVISVDGVVVAKDLGAAERGDINIGRIAALSNAGFTGEVNYSTGTISVDGVSAPANGKELRVAYQIDWEEEEEPRYITQQMDSKLVTAEVFALAAESSLLKSYELVKTFGKGMSDDKQLEMLNNHIAQEVGGRAIRKLLVAAPGGQAGASIFYKRPQAGVSNFEHKQELGDILAASDAKMLAQGGVGSINCIIAGVELCAVYSRLPGFIKLTQSPGVGPQVFGTYEGITIIRVSEAALLGPRQSINLYKTDIWNAPMVFAPWCPALDTGSIPRGKNPFSSHRGIIQASAIEACAPQYITLLNMEDAVQP